MTQLKKVRDYRRTDLAFVLIEPQDFNPEFHAEFVETNEVVPAAEPEISPFVSDTKPIESKPRKPKKEEPNISDE